MSESGAGAVRMVDIGPKPLSVDEVLAAVRDPSAGGTAVFIGTVRRDDGGRAVAGITYEAHPDALSILQRIACAIAHEHGALAVAAVHRTGPLAVGELAVVVAAAAGHRAAAFAAARGLIDEIKAAAPIWKRQTFVDGDVEWVGMTATLEVDVAAWPGCEGSAVVEGNSRHR